MSEVQHTKRREISVLNWMGTLVLSAIPVVNLIMFIVWTITAKHASKRTYAIAALILIGIVIVLSVAAVAFFAPQILSGIETLRGWLDPTVLPTV